jgi:hypothetical protein
MRKIYVYQSQLTAAYDFLKQFENKSSVTEIEVLHNNLMFDQLVIRYVETFVSEDGNIGNEVRYVCFDKYGTKADCFEMYGADIYARMLKDFYPVKLTDKNIEVL